MKQKTFLGATAIAMSIGPAAMAASVNIDQIGAIWAKSDDASIGANAPTGTPEPAFTDNLIIQNGDEDPTSGGETVSISWGDPASSPVGDPNGAQSEYEFDPTGDPSPTGPLFVAEADTPYSLGTFTHFNEPIWDSGGSLLTADLILHFAGTPIDPAAGGTQSFGAVFKFSHDETVNETDVFGNPDLDACDTPPQVSNVPCDDLVTLDPVGGVDEVVVVGDVEYTFTLLGFAENENGVPGDFNPFGSLLFATTEGQANETDLWFSYSVNVVPLPAAGWLLLAGIGGLAAVGRRRKKA